MIQRNSELSVRRQCELLGVTRSTVYYEPQPEDAESLQHKEIIMGRIDYWHTAMPFLGTRKIVAQLRGEGYAVGRKLVRSYMHSMGIHTIYPKPNLSKRNFRESVVPYLLRNKVVSFPNQVWSIDITYIKMYHGHRLVQSQGCWLDIVRYVGYPTSLGSCPECCGELRHTGYSKFGPGQSIHQ